MVGIILNHDLDCAQRRQRLFEGALLVHTPRDATAALADHAIALITEMLSAEDPERAQFALPVDQFIAKVGPLKSRFTNDLQTKKLVREVLIAFGCDLETTYFDVPRLRVVPHGGYLSSGVSYAYKAHRDIWYASPTAQVNWWMPVFEVTAERAMSFFPEYWDRPVENSSADFDYGEWCRVGRTMASSQVTEDTRKHPLPLAPVETRSELRIAGTKGDAILFSAAHLHSTAPNQSGLTRFSIDFRTVNLADLEAGRGAANIDSRATGTTLGDFLRASDFEPLDAGRWASPHQTAGSRP
ncbi:hypothetical protein [Arenimonas oryziterrae]|uniref:Phytanoyl-CoA dioxygenase n=1 Tax=Arenimonas oryziterrae DSM 21050 = YC6267 TaxID=1121015 RepID=A0A091BFG5_9GAMM|nr:hypothetical protein [Arenimonas oryziterrae]KFN43130.1 hypothetical protein N789_11245 [Arenimonas oryziterrae DSM 21050 = YC6267]